MAQVALSRAQPSSPHRPPSRSSRGRPSTFTSAIARELADRAALVSRIRYKGSTFSLSKSRGTHSAHGTECVEGDLLSENVLPLYLMRAESIAVLTGPSESPPKWSVYVMVSPALMAPTLVTASAMMAELGPVPLGPRHAVACARHAIILVCRNSCRLQQARSFLDWPTHENEISA